MKTPKQIAEGMTVEQAAEVLRLAIDRLTAGNGNAPAVPVADLEPGKFAVWTDPKAAHKALACARGRYQRDLILGIEAPSGSTITGRAAFYKDFYARSRKNLFARMAKAKVHFKEHKNVLSIG